MATIQHPLQFLLESEQSVPFDDEEDGFETLEMRQAQCCKDLVQQIKTSNKCNIRDLFDCKFSDLTLLLGDLITHRLDYDAILPATQDDTANEEAISGTTNAMTITYPAICAAELYAHLLATPGALGSGLVALEAVTALTAIVRRWAIECCGREDLLRDGRKGYRTSTKSPPKKRSRSAVIFGDRQDLADDIDEINVTESSSEPETILKAGLSLALALTKIPAEREFSTWSYEAREAILEAVNTAFATSAAVKSMNKIGFEVVEDASKSFVRAVSNSSSKPKQQEMSVALLRGLLRIMQFKEVLPNGERGKLEAHSAASASLLCFVQNFSSSTTRQSLGTLRTPNRNERDARHSPSLATASGGKTPKSHRRRASLDGVTPMLSPALKKGVSLATVGTHANKCNPVLSVLLGMMQKLTVSPGFERASTRTPTIKAIQRCLSSFPRAERAQFLRYIFKLSQSKVSIHRLVACEIIGNSLAEEWLEIHGEDPLKEDKEGSPMSVTEEAQQSLPTALWRALQGRLLDRIAAVRARAASSLEAAINTNACWMEESLLTVLRKRALLDETATVRKASLSAITQILLVRKEWMSEWHLSALCELCQDPSILTRKAAAESLTALLEAYSEHHCNSLLEESWSNCVLPMILDEEVGTKAIALLDRLVVSPILSEGGMNKSQTMWRILGHVGSAAGQQGASKGPSQALRAALKQLSLEDKNRVHIDLMKHTLKLAHKAMDDENMCDGAFVGMWCLLENILVQCNDIGSVVNKSQSSIRSFEVCLAAWKRILAQQSRTANPSFRSTLRSSLVVASHLATSLHHSVVSQNKQELQEALERFMFPPNIIPAAVSALVAMAVRSSNTGKSIDVESHIRRLYDRCEAELSSFIQHASMSRADFAGTTCLQNSVVEALFTVGELSMIGFSSDENEKSATVSDAERGSVQGLHIGPTRNLVDLVQTLLSSQLPGSKGMKNPDLYRAHAFTVLGKLCLRDEALTKASLNLLARELQASVESSSPAIQSNVLLVLGDLSVRYTNMTDRYLPILATCLQTGAAEHSEFLMSNTTREFAVVRRHAVLLLSSLLLQDYIKWRGLLFHRFLVACCDDDEGVAHLAESVLSGPLWTRNPKLFYNHFVESIFVLNKCSAHPIYVAAVMQGDGGSGIAVGFEGINLSGEVGKSRRRNMYDFMLSKLSDEEKIGVIARLAKEVLGGALSENGDLGKVCQIASTETHPQLESAWNVINDTFYVLTNGGINVGRVVEGDELEDPNIPNSSRQVTVAKSRLLSKISRKQMIEIVLPILCNLKVKLQSHCSPLLKDLMRYLCEIFQQFKTEAKEFLANDPTLLHEIEYDMRQMR
ncbi:unnamed protein product [Cylindrotheca closterium]|uniref:Condensin complex subunit 1 C-terminal domain-containing protein n=1 Tax=Cylindrotheca closterium TaxID=2856 RepID=A0AAD2CU52_9STRA|nr:unnamed protein product [Cylindrotheca closterium]